MKITETHIKTVTGKIWKILPLFESENEGITTYIDSLIYELEGLATRLNEQQGSMLQSITDVLRRVRKESTLSEPDLTTIRREVLSCTSLFNKIFEQGDHR